MIKQQLDHQGMEKPEGLPPHLEASVCRDDTA